MKMILACFLLLILGCLSDLVNTRTLHIDSCSVNVHIHELRKYYSDIRTHALSEDTEVGLQLLDRSLIKQVQEGQTCCFVRLLLRFYVERVFSNYSSPQALLQRCSSALANAFVSIRREMHNCHCLCAEETQRTIDSIHAEFNKLPAKDAAQKAVGELDTVLGWLEGL